MIKKGKYQHYKGDDYEVIGVGLDSDTHEEMVVYRGLYDHPEFGKNPLWVRKKNIFTGKVVVDGKEVPRFRFVGE